MFNFIPAPYVGMAKIIAVLALLAALIGATIYAYHWAYDKGAEAEKLTWVTAQNKALTDAQSALAATNSKLQSLQAAYNTTVTDNSAAYQKGLKDGQTKKTAAIASVNDGSLVLRDKYAASCPESKADPVQTNAAPGGRDAETRPGLSRETSEFLVGLTSEADEVVKQLSACQVDYQALYNQCSNLPTW